VIGRKLTDVLRYSRPDVLDDIAASLRGETREREFHSDWSGLLIAHKSFPIAGGCGVTFRDITQSRRLEIEAEQRAAELQAIYESAPVGLALLDENRRYLRVNAALAAINGVPAEAHIGRTVSEIVPRVASELSDSFMRVVRTGEPVFDLEISGETPARPGERRTWIENIAPVRKPDGTLHAIQVSLLEITARKRAEAGARLLLNELNHRVKNTLATIQSIAAQTLRSRSGLEGFREAFEARLVALAGTHDVLTAEQWEGAGLRQLLDKELAPYAPEGQVRMEGPNVRLNAQATLALGLVAHELATNAAKYGALSTPEGRVCVQWSLLDGGLELIWREAGGPAVTPPQRRGFGSRLIERSVRGELAGTVDLDFTPEGLRCTIQIARSVLQRD
jgi:two-component system, chemotaxis family, CheB/CheR fusion protein